MIEELGGSALPAFGFGCVIERIIHTLLGQKVELPKRPSAAITFIPLDEEAKPLCFEWVSTLRSKHIPAEMDLTNRKLKAAMRDANKSGASYVAVVGEDELKNKKLQLKNMESGETESLCFDEVIKRFEQC